MPNYDQNSMILHLINYPNIDSKARWLLSRVLFTTNLRTKMHDDFLFKVQQLRPNIELWCRNFLLSRSPMLVALWDTIHLFGCMSLDARLRSSWNNTSVHYAKKVSCISLLLFRLWESWLLKIKRSGRKGSKKDMLKLIQYHLHFSFQLQGSCIAHKH